MRLLIGLKTKQREEKNKLSLARLGVFAPEVLGRADTDYDARSVARAGAGKGFTGEVAESQKLSQRERGVAIGGDR